MELDCPTGILFASISWYFRVYAATCETKKYDRWGREGGSFGLVMNLFLLWFLGPALSV